MHLGGVRFGSAYHNAWTALKLLLIVALIVAGFALGDTQPISFGRAPPTCRKSSARPFAISLVFVMYSYSGWNAATYIVGELKDPVRNVPRALFFGTCIVIVLYVSLECRVSDDHADQGIGRSARCRHHRRQAHFRRFRRPHRRRADLPGADFFDQRHDLDRPARRHDHGRGPAAAAAVLAPVETQRTGQSQSCSNS